MMKVEQATAAGGPLPPVIAGGTQRQDALYRGQSQKTARSERYRDIQTAVNVQKDIVRKYRKSRERGVCNSFAKKLCSRRSTTGYWVDSHQATSIFYLGILLNAAFLVYEAFVTDVEKEDRQWTFIGTQWTFIVLYTGEAVLRLRAGATEYSRWDGLLDPWTDYDLLLIVVYFVDVNVLVWTSSLWDVHRLVVHLLPALALVRLGRFVPPLRLIIKGIFNAMKAVLWAVVLLLLVIYFFAVLCFNFVGRAQYFRDDEFAKERFSNLGEAMFSLFTYATLEDFADTIRHFMASGPPGIAVAVGILGFILLTNMALLNLLTAIMVDSIIDILPKKNLEKMVEERAHLVRRMEELFADMDADGNRKLTLKELRDGVTNLQDVRDELSKLQVAEFDLAELFMLVDFNDNGVVSVDEFIEGLLRVAPGPASKKELLGVQYDLHKMWNMLGSGQEWLHDMQEEVRQEFAEHVTDVERGLQESIARLEARIEAMFGSHFEAVCMRLVDSNVHVLQSLQSSGVLRAAEKLDLLQSTLAAVPQVVEDNHHKMLAALEAHSRQVASSQMVAIPGRAGGTSAMEKLVQELVSIVQARAGENEQVAPFQIENDPVSEEVVPLFAAQPKTSLAANTAVAAPVPPVHGPAPAPPPPEALPRAQSRGAGHLPSKSPLSARSPSAQRDARHASTRPASLPIARRGLSAEHPALSTPPQLPGVVASSPRVTDSEAKVAGAELWILQQGLSKVPFDKLILQLDRIGVELNSREQDELRWRLSPNAAQIGRRRSS